MKISDVLKKEISFYSNKKEISGTIITIGEALKQIENGMYKNQISMIRNLISLQKYEEAKFKKSCLPAVTFSGVFYNGHQKKNLNSYNDIVVIDIDKLEQENLYKCYDLLKNDKYILSCWISPSGKGIKGLVKISFKEEIALENIHIAHKAVFDLLKEYFCCQYSINLDSSGNDTSRLCFVSYDPNIYINENFSAFTFNESIANVISRCACKIKRSPHKKTKSLNRKDDIFAIDKFYLNPEGKNNPHHRELMNSILRFLKRRNLSITEKYEQWLRVAFAIADSFSCDIGLRYYLKLCELDGNRYNENDSRKNLKYCYEKTRGNITFATILFYAQKVGFKPG